MFDDDMEMLEAARRVCKEKHAGQVDKMGKPYYLHPYAVADKVGSPEEKCVAYLHDVVEDTDTTLDDLRGMGFPDEVVEGVDAVTRRDGESYFDFIRRCKRNDIGRVVKIADVQHNTSPERAAGRTPSLEKRYSKAMAILLDDGIGA